jgi:hypothetical protein
MQAGQENSFGWPAMSAGLIDQYAKLATLRDQRKIRVETLRESAKWFRDTFKTTPATAVVALEDSKGDATRSIWYESKFYRVNLYWEGDQWRIRDLHVFSQDYPERYLEKQETSAVATYDTLPVMDGFHWSKPGELAGIRGVLQGAEPMRTKGLPAVQEAGMESLVVTCELASGGSLRFRCDPAKLAIELTGEPARSDWGLELAWAKDKEIPVANVGKHAIGYRHQGFDYSLSCGSSEVSRAAGENKIRIKEARDSVIFTFDADKSSSSNDGGE